jgi:hypothetical protein
MLSISGKTTILGIYSTDINIGIEPTVPNQLVFIFILEADADDPFQEITLRIDLPGGDFREQQVALQRLTDGQADKVRWRLHYPLLFQNPILRAGPILAKVTHEKGELTPAAPFIVMRPRVMAAGLAVPAAPATTAH